MKWLPLRNNFACSVMAPDLVSLARCLEFSGLTWEELPPRVAPSTRCTSLYASYLLLLPIGSAVVRDRIVADIRLFLDLGASRRAADLLVVLRWFLFAHPDARIRSPPGDN